MTTGLASVNHDTLAKSGQAVANYLREEITLIDLSLLTARVQAKIFSLLAEADDTSIKEFSEYFHYAVTLLDVLRVSTPPVSDE